MLITKRKWMRERERDTVRVNGLSLEGKNVSMLVRVKEKERKNER